MTSRTVIDRTPWTTELVQLAVSTAAGGARYRPVIAPAEPDAAWRLFRSAYVDHGSSKPAAADRGAAAPTREWSSHQLDLLAPVVDRLGGLALLRRNRTISSVVEVALLPWCPACVTGDHVEPAYDAKWYALPTSHGDLAAVSVLCADHARLAGSQARPLPLGELAAAVGAPVGWASPAAVARLQPRVARRRWSGQARGPLLADRTVAGLRMGHVGYAPPAAIRLDVQRRVLLVDLDAPAPQRPTGPCLLPVRRTVALGYQVYVGIDDGDRYDLAWSQPGPPVAGRNEATVSDVRGLWATPLLAATLDRPTGTPVGLEGPTRRPARPTTQP